jgi:hypothetical protein
MKDFHLSPMVRTLRNLNYYLMREADGGWTLNAEGFAIRVFRSKTEAIAGCTALVDGHAGPLRIETPEGTIERSAMIRPATPPAPEFSARRPERAMKAQVPMSC